MTDSFYEPLAHWTDSVGYDDGYTMSIDERLAADPVSYEDMEQSWLAYQEELEQPRRPKKNTIGKCETLMDYLFATNKSSFVTIIQEPYIPGYLQSNTHQSYMVTLPYIVGPTESDIVYMGYERFNNTREIVNHLTVVCGYPDVNDDDNPLDYIYTCDENPKSWARINQELDDID